MVIDEVYRILQYAFDNKLTIKEAITKLNVNVKYSTGIQEKWLNQSDSAKCSIPLLD